MHHTLKAADVSHRLVTRQSTARTAEQVAVLWCGNRQKGDVIQVQFK